MYGKLVNGTLIYAPDNFLTEDGKFILDFKNNIEEVIKEGFKEIIDVLPDYNSHTQKIVKTGYKETNDSIQVVYNVEEKPMSIEEELESEKELAVKLLVETLPDYKAKQIPLLFNSWKSDTEYKKGDRVEYKMELYKVKSDIISSYDDKPDNSVYYKKL